MMPSIDPYPLDMRFASRLYNRRPHKQAHKFFYSVYHSRTCPDRDIRIRYVWMK